ncbi:MAG TPA: DUF4956 domain-containing protein [Bryobacteraceae bacterium]|nr:DUF4956 domain-containing protein [Bryobacteraceae bacterium]
MLEFLTATFSPGPAVAPLDILTRFVAALLCGFAIAWLHRRTRHNTDPSVSFFSTLVLLSVLIAMVTQVIGDNVARAFSLVGALSIVRFRTVLRDTEDTAYVIFAVVTGMAVGARNVWVAGLGMLVIAAAAVVLKWSFVSGRDPEPDYLLTVRFGLGNNMQTLIAQPFSANLQRHDLLKIGTTRQGASFEATFLARLRPGTAAEEFVQQLNQVNGIHDVQIERRILELG